MPAVFLANARSSRAAHKIVERPPRTAIFHEPRLPAGCGRVGVLLERSGELTVAINRTGRLGPQDLLDCRQRRVDFGSLLLRRRDRPRLADGEKNTTQREDNGNPCEGHEQGPPSGSNWRVSDPSVLLTRSRSDAYRCVRINCIAVV